MSVAEQPKSIDLIALLCFKNLVFQLVSPPYDIVGNWTAGSVNTPPIGVRTCSAIRLVSFVLGLMVPSVWRMQWRGG